MNASTRREDGVDVVAVMEAMAALAPGARAQFVDDVFTLDLPSRLHQATVMQVARSIVLPDKLVTLPRLLISDGIVWIMPDLGAIPEPLALTEEPAVLTPADLSLMVEVLSPSSERFDRGPKRQFAERHGIDYWIVAPGDPWGWIEYMPYGGGVVTFPLAASTEQSA